MLRAIEDTQGDPARLRKLVYDVTRLSLGKQLLSNYRELGEGGLQKYVVELEIAIKEAERLSQQKENEALAFRLDVQLLGEPANSSSGMTVTSTETAAGKGQQNTLPVPITSRALSGDVLRLPELLPAIEMWEPAFARKIERQNANWPRRADLIIAVLIGIVIYGVFFGRPDLFPKPATINSHTEVSAVSSIASPSNGTERTPGVVSSNALEAQALGFPLPTEYGVYAVSAGKLFELSALPMKIPDPRVAISAMIQAPSQVTVPDGNVSFVIFRRDLTSTAPMELFVRVVARVARAMEFPGNASPKTTEVNDQWAVRGKSYPFRVSPLSNNPEMITVHSADAKLSLSPGRYALVIGGQGYDFAIDGQVTDTAQCLERTEVVGGAVYSECRSLPKSVL